MNSIRQFRKDVRAYTLADIDIAALIGDRLYSVRAGQRENMPYAVMEVVAGRDELTHSGTIGLEEMRLQVTIVARTTDETDTVRDAIVGRLSGLSGPIGSVTNIAFCVYDLEIDNDEEFRRVSKTLDFRIKLNKPQ